MRVPVNKVKANGLLWPSLRKSESITSCRLHGAKQSPTHADLSGEDRKPPSQSENLLRICSHVLKPPYPCRETTSSLIKEKEKEVSDLSVDKKKNETESLFREHTALFLSQAVRSSSGTCQSWESRWILGGHHTGHRTPLQLILHLGSIHVPDLLTLGVLPTHLHGPSHCCSAQPPPSVAGLNKLSHLGTMEAFVIFPFFEWATVCMRIQITLVGGAGDYLWESVRTGLSRQAGGESGAAQSQECYHGEPGQALLGSVAENTLHSCRTRQIEKIVG